jgi:hypothetical protein
MRQHGAYTTERQDTNNQLVLDLDVVVGLDHSIELMEIGVVTRVQWGVVHHAFLSVWCDDPKATTCVPRDGYAIEARLVREVVVRESSISGSFGRQMIKRLMPDTRSGV